MADHVSVACFALHEHQPAAAQGKVDDEVQHSIADATVASGAPAPPGTQVARGTLVESVAWGQILQLPPRSRQRLGRSALVEVACVAQWSHAQAQAVLEMTRDARAVRLGGLSFDQSRPLDRSLLVLMVKLLIVEVS